MDSSNRLFDSIIHQNNVCISYLIYFILGDYASEEEADAAYEEDYAEWEALEPQEEDYLDEYNAAYEEWVAAEPQLEDFVIWPDGSVG